MARFCTKCGRPLSEGEKCVCRSLSDGEKAAKRQSFLAKLLNRMGIGTPSNDSHNLFENGQEIVPEITCANEGEIPIKQYEVSSLRSRIRGQYAKGRLQVTTKRVIFRAAGMSYKGPIAQHYEFAVNEIAGIEIKKTNRISILNIFLCLILNSFVSSISAEIFHGFAAKTPGLALFFAIHIALASIVPFFVMHKKFWLKLAIMSFGLGALSGCGNLSNISASSLMFGLEANAADIIVSVLYVVWLLNMILVALVPDLVLTIKTKGATEAFTIRRKQFPTPFKQAVEHTNFAEIVPAKDLDTMTSEIYALINDVQNLGDLAVEKWKEK